MASILVVSVSLLFFCPSPVGGFQASHGPTSTLKEHNAGLHLDIQIVASALITTVAEFLRFERSWFPSLDGNNYVLAWPSVDFNLLRC